MSAQERSKEFCTLSFSNTESLNVSIQTLKAWGICRSASGGIDHRQITMGFPFRRICSEMSTATQLQ